MKPWAALGEQMGELAELIAASVENADWDGFADLVGETVDQAVENAEEAVEAAEEAAEAAADAAEEAAEHAAEAAEEIDA